MRSLRTRNHLPQHSDVLKRPLDHPGGAEEVVLKDRHDTFRLRQPSSRP
jgi:hypothetical protein